MYYYFTKKGRNRFPMKCSQDYFIKTGLEPYKFNLTAENKILVNNIKCLI